MSDLYYVRIRGAVVGPFRPEQVRQLVERGKISRLHELSADRETWRPLRDFPELAVAPAASAVATPSTPSDGDTAAGQDSSQPPPVTKPQWYYDDAGQAAGPVDEAAIAALVAAGRITPSTLVWTSGMKTWEPAQQTPLGAYLHPAVGAPRFVSSASAGTGPADAEGIRKVIDAATSSIPWARATCLLFGILVGILALLDILFVLMGPSAVARVFSFFSLLFWSGYLWTYIVGFRYTSYLTSLRFTQRDSDFIKALNLLRHFWQWQAVLAVVAAALVVLLVLVVVAAGVDVVAGLARGGG